MTFQASLDKLAKGISVAITVLFAIIICLPFFLPNNNEEGIAVAVYTSVILVVIYLVTLGYRPIHYAVTTDELIVHRWFKDVIIEKANIQSIEAIDRKKIKGSLRVFGVGGLFGYFGKFTNDTIGSMTWYATRRDNIILVITTDNEKTILTPDEPDLFLAEFK